MEKFYYEVPSMERKEDAIDFINEFYEYNSDINGTGSLHKYLDDYEGWLEKLENDYNRIPDEERVPARTYFLIRENDNKIIGMANIRVALNERLKEFGGHIGYGIRPTERNKGYNKINLYLALQICKSYDIETALLDADLDNPASWKTMGALGGKCIRQGIDPYDEKQVKVYEIDVNKSLEDYKDTYGQYIKEGNNNERGSI